MRRKLEQRDRSNELVRELLRQMIYREPNLMNNSAMLAAVYLDPRFSFKLTTDEKRIARTTLETMHDRIHHKNSQDMDQEQIDDSFEEDCVRSGLARTYLNESKPASPAEMVLDRHFIEFEAIGRIHHKKEIFQWWSDHSEEFPILFEVASIILSIPPSQTTVERAFSTLNYIYNCRRTRLTPDTLENILMININRDLVPAIFERDLIALGAGTHPNIL